MRLHSLHLLINRAAASLEMKTTADCLVSHCLEHAAQRLISLPTISINQIHFLHGSMWAIK